MIRDAAVAGTFYPADPEDLQSQIQSLLALSTIPVFATKVLIVPHAGYIYSGQVAAQAYRLLQKNSRINQVLLLGPAHYVYVEGLAVPSTSYFATPLGTIPINRQAIDTILRLPQVSVCDEAHEPEHSLEVQLPFLQVVLGEFELVPILVGNSSAAETAAVIDQLWGGEETLVLISSDLSHFHPYTKAQQIDQATNAAICGMSERLNGEQACGCRAINGLMHSAKNRDLSVNQLALSNSGDSSGDKNRVVGYGAYALN